MSKINMNFALHLIPMLAGVAIMAYPDLEGPDLEAKVEDHAWAGLKHVMGDRGYLVDLLRGLPMVGELVHLAVSKEVAAAQEELQDQVDKGAGVVGDKGEAPGSPVTESGTGVAGLTY